MITTYRLHANELSVELINSIKAAFKDKTVKIVVSDEIDESNNAFGVWTNEEEDIYQDYLK